MKAGLLAILGFMAASCGQNPLLKIVASSYAPVKVGTQWTYVTPAGAPGFERRVVAAGTYFGREAYQVDTVFPGITTTAHLAYTGHSIEQYKAASAEWETIRKLPYVVGNRWDLIPSTNVTSKVWVERRGTNDTENLDLPAGSFVRCYSIRTETQTYNPGTGLTSTTETLAWAAPGVGDVQYGSLVNGVVNVSFMLSSYSPGP